ncbi:MAG: hypothetical protein RSD49_16375 [Hafnia sp.]
MGSIEQAATHVFEASGLGKPPFRLVGYRDAGEDCVRCEHCSTRIKNIFLVASSDDRIALVGSTCVRKTGDKGLINQLKRQLSQQRQEKLKDQKEKAAKEAQAENERLQKRYQADPRIADSVRNDPERLRRAATFLAKVDAGLAPWPERYGKLGDID